MTDTTQQLVVSLTDNGYNNNNAKPGMIDGIDLLSPSRVGGKASSLATLSSALAGKGHGKQVVPRAHALTVDFFEPWIRQLKSSPEFRALSSAKASGDDDDFARTRCEKLQRASKDLPLSDAQRNAIQGLVDDMLSREWKGVGSANNCKLAAVRSSAPEEDGTSSSYAGAFDTVLGVSSTFNDLERAIRKCFASLWDYRVFDYKRRNNRDGDTAEAYYKGFAVVVMEMIDSLTAGVAFSANPLNSDRDEIVVDSSWGLGESVVDGSVTADRYVYDKVNSKLVEETIGNKPTEKRLGPGGGVVVHDVDEKRKTMLSLTRNQVNRLAESVRLVEEAYGMPMDIEWAFVEEEEKKGGGGDDLELKLLQARPITTLFTLDENMMTEPGEKRKLYFDYNIISEATTTSPFTTMDMETYRRLTNFLMGVGPKESAETNWDFISDDPEMPMFAASTRQYLNMGLVFKYVAPETFAKLSEMMDPYLTATFRSKDCDRKKYRAKKLPPGITLKSSLRWVKKIPLWTMYKMSRKYNRDPKAAEKEYIRIVMEDEARLRELVRNRTETYSSKQGVAEYFDELVLAINPSVMEECSILFFLVLPIFQELDKERKDQRLSEEIRSEYEGLCQGYVGDPLMEINIAMYELANALPESIWNRYGHDDMAKLLERVQENLDSDNITDLPSEFLVKWKSFMETYGYDGQDQLFVSCPRYRDSPELLLGKLRLNALGAKHPGLTQTDQLAERRRVMAKQEERARSAGRWWRCNPFALSKVRKRNAVLEHLMWIRNAPKIRLALVEGMVRAELLKLEDALIEKGRLDEKGDIFHLTLEEVDRGTLEDASVDLMEIVKPRKAVYDRALRQTLCPLLVDSRCRILQPDPPKYKDGEEPEEGTLVGAAISPGTATGKVRIVHSPDDRFEQGEVLCAVVTGPAWTPLFASASAVVLQLGGVLQHGALCAREYGKPAVSNIDIHRLLKDGMMVAVDGNTGIVKILEEE